MSLIETGAAPVRTCARAQLPLPSGVRDWLQVASLAVVCVASFGLRPSALLSPEFAARTTFTGLLLAMAAKARPAAPAPPRAARGVDAQALDHLGLRALIPVVPVAVAQGNLWVSTIRLGYGPSPRDGWATIADLGLLVPLLAALMAFGVPPVLFAQVMDAGAPASPSSSWRSMSP